MLYLLPHLQTLSRHNVDGCRVHDCMVFRTACAFCGTVRGFPRLFRGAPLKRSELACGCMYTLVNKTKDGKTRKLGNDIAEVEIIAHWAAFGRPCMLPAFKYERDHPVTFRPQAT